MVDPALQRELWDTANRLADVAGEICLPLFRSPVLNTDNKDADGYDPVTQADRNAEKAMRAVLAELRPDDAILGEEYGAKPGTSGLTWVLDPVDGTRAFISGAPTWGILIGVDAGDGPVMGVVDQPFTGERFIGGFGRAEVLRAGKTTPLAVRPCSGLESAVLYTTFPEIGTTQERARFERVRDQVRLTRYGFDCYGYALVAMGQVDLVIEAGLNAYDIQGPQAVIEAAGGVVTNWEGGPCHDGGRVIAAGDPDIHAAALELMNSGEA